VQRCGSFSRLKPVPVVVVGGGVREVFSKTWWWCGAGVDVCVCAMGKIKNTRTQKHNCAQACKVGHANARACHVSGCSRQGMGDDVRMPLMCLSLLLLLLCRRCRYEPW
jgi:hypothetical protein